tara:strand:- start:267 stop:680 length:414 start_codon:yes stop_codon:yes gene_type:complete
VPIRRLVFSVTLLSVLQLAGCTAQPGELSLRNSFAAQIAAVEGVRNFEDSGQVLNFTGPDGEGGSSVWRIEINSTTLEPRADERLPFAGHVVSSWYQNLELVEFLGTMSRLPQVYLDAGVAQECYALWDLEVDDWDW